MTVLSIIVIMLTSLLNSTLRILSSSESDQERHRSGRALTDFIGRELRAATLPAETKTLANQANLQLVINPTQLNTSDNSGGAAYFNADSIFWQAPLATDSTYGDMAEVGYFVKWINRSTTGSTVLTPTLCRFFVNPSITDASGTATQNPDFQIYKNQTDWLTSDLLTRLVPAVKPDYVGLFAENVLGMWVQAYGIDGSDLSINHAGYDSRVGYPLQTGQSGGLAERRYLPSLIKISIAQVDAKYAARLAPSVSTIRQQYAASVNATAFYKLMQGNPLLPGIRIYSTDVFLDNAR